MTRLPFSRLSQTVIFLVICLSGSLARAQTTLNTALPRDIVSVSERCNDPWVAWLVCRPSKSLEQRLEREYWSLVGETDIGGMSAWLEKAKRYVDGSRTPRAGRIATLITAGQIMVYRSYDMLDLSGLPALFEMIRWAEKAYELAPDSPNTGGFYYFTKAYGQFALSDVDGGMSSIETMLEFPARYGALGSEGEVVAAMALGMLSDTDHAQETLDILQDCTTANCRRTTSLAPFKEIGMLLAIAESYGKVGDLDGMEASFERARTLAEELDWPFVERIDEARDTLTRPGGLLDQWASGGARLGYIQLPMPPSTASEACANCHVGARIPAGTYD